MTDTPGGLSDKTLFRVLAVFISGVAINQLSDLFSISAPIIVILALLALLLLLAVESPAIVGDRLSAKATSTPVSDLAKFSLASLLLGAIVGSLSVIPIWNSHRFVMPWHAYFHNYEVGAVVVLVSLACVAAARRTPFYSWFTFLVSSLAGMTLAIVYLKTENDFLATFLGWLTVGALMTLTVGLFPDILRLFAEFLGLRSLATKDQGAIDLRDRTEPPSGSGHALLTRPSEADGNSARQPAVGGEAKSQVESQVERPARDQLNTSERRSNDS